MRLNIAGMSGPPCQRKIEQALVALPGIYSAVVCLDRGYADVDYGEDLLSTGDLLQTIEKAGYQARLGG